VKLAATTFPAFGKCGMRILSYVAHGYPSRATVTNSLGDFLPGVLDCQPEG